MVEVGWWGVIRESLPKLLKMGGGGVKAGIVRRGRGLEGVNTSNHPPPPRQILIVHFGRKRKSRLSE